MLNHVIRSDQRGEYLEVTCVKGRQFTIDAIDRHLLSERWFVLRSRHNARTEYVARSTGPGIMLLHRQIMDAPKGLEVDHIDGNGLHDRRHNMRLATHAQNKGNSHYPKWSSTGYRGVYPAESGRFTAIISIGGKMRYLGTFDDPVTAAKARDDAAVAARGEFTQLNFPKVPL